MLTNDWQTVVLRKTSYFIYNFHKLSHNKSPENKLICIANGTYLDVIWGVIMKTGLLGQVIE